MSLQNFWDNVRRGISLPYSHSIADAPAIGAEQIEEALRKDTRWLTPRSVAGYDEADFPFLPQQDRQRLTTLVTQFRDAALQAPPTGPTTQEQIDRALPPFLDIAAMLEFGRYAPGEALRIGKLVEARIAPWRPAELAELLFETGKDHTGEPGIWIWGIIADTPGDEDYAQFLRHAGEIRPLLQDATREVTQDFWPYVQFRSVSEQQEVEQEQPA